MAGPFKAFGILFMTGIMLASCSSSATSDKTAQQAASGNKAKVKIEAPKQVRTGLAQRASEINIPVRGKITRTGEIYLLRGIANVFSRGMDTMGAKMVRKGLDARVYNHAAWKDLANNIIARKNKRQVSYPIIIIGHSLGANAAALMANYLGSNGVKVSYVVGFDPTTTGKFGKNISRVVNFYLPNKSASNVYKKAPGFRGSVKNINVRGVRGIKHTTIEKDSKFQAQVINRAYSYTKKRRRKRR